MVFYKIEAERDASESKEITRQEGRARADFLAEKSETLFQKSLGKSMVFTVYIDDSVTFGAIGKTESAIKTEFSKYIKKLPFTIISYKMEEVTFSAFENLISTARRNFYISTEEALLKKFEIEEMSARRIDCDFGEGIIDENLTVDDCKNIANEYLFTDTITPELERIYNGGVKAKLLGHPVHYILTTDDRNIRKKVYKALLSALYNNGRIVNKRYTFVDYNSESFLPGASLEALYRASEGGAFVIRYTDADEKDNGFARRSADVISALCEIASKYKNKVLTIICLPQNANKIKDEFMLNFSNTAFVELYENVAFGKTAITYLKLKAKNENVRCNKKLTDKIENGKGYTATELNRIFDMWYSEKLRNEIYPQYKTVNTAKNLVKQSKPRGTAYDKLEKLIGLTNAKSVMKNALNYFKVQALFADRGMLQERPSMHMVFTGNPGTAKTTVARLFADIMKENGLLENGDMYEVGRADLVGKYVGSTAPLVKAAFKRAKGGVLFIDEAYSLVDDRDGLFGDEAINTIVQEMENNRKDTVVIFAGYPDKMESFLNKNPGLRSRIAFHVPFADYSSAELCNIAKLIADEKNLQLSDDAVIKLEKLFEAARSGSDFGNGRYARNVIEKAKMAQANRLMKMDIDKITDEQLMTIVADDIEIPEKGREKTIKFGFCA